MSNLEMRINAICNVLVAEGEPERKAAVEELKQAMTLPADKPDVDGTIRDLFMELGVPDHLIGYEYAIYAIKLAVEDRNMLNNIVHRLMPTVALEFATTTSRAERVIRHLTQETLGRGNRTALDKYIGNLVNPETNKIPNSEFIGRMANIVKQKLRQK